ncbi:hypothetical protein BDZ89DRAFT_1111589 [Hymenopellis radicata]|nr:hypothetical protein BDZ89DRAFT_1111589 [Hymenopellis radicata]
MSASMSIAPASLAAVNFVLRHLCPSFVLCRVEGRLAQFPLPARIAKGVSKAKNDDKGRMDHQEDGKRTHEASSSSMPIPIEVGARPAHSTAISTRVAHSVNGDNNDHGNVLS